MSQSNALVAVLKTALKQHGLTYADLAKKLVLSEANIKRMFSTQNFSLKRLDDICQVMHLELTDLLKLLEDSKQRVTHLTKEQEKELVSNPKLLLIAMCARNHITFDEILEMYSLDKLELIKLLAKLDQIHFIELLPNNLIKLVVASDFHWIPLGPVENYYAKQVEEDFFKSRFYKKNETRLFITGMLTEESLHNLQRKLYRVAKDFSELQKQDLTQTIEKRNNIGMVLAMRPWTLKAFNEIKK